jgi:hypothetical protein
MLEKLLVEVVEKHPDKTAIVYEPFRISYRDYAPSEFGKEVVLPLFCPTVLNLL